jgi:type IV pilus assembly protein PilZ
MNQAKPSVSQLQLKNKAALYAAYMDWTADGGVFVPTQRNHKLGDNVYLLLGLPDDPQLYPLVGKVVWLTPERAPDHRAQGVGVQFPETDAAREIKIKIETLLGVQMSSAQATHTL